MNQLGPISLGLNR